MTQTYFLACPRFLISHLTTEHVKSLIFKGFQTAFTKKGREKIAAQDFYTLNHDEFC